MKRILPIVLTALLLAGCAAGQTPETEPATEATQAATEPPALVSLYDEDSQVEKATDGAVRAYPLGDGRYSQLLVMGERLLVVSQEGYLTALQGELGQVAATAMAENAVDLKASPAGVAYFDTQTREVVLLDTDLQQLQRVKVPEECSQEPVVLQDGQVFYCTDSEIRAFDATTGVARLVRQHTYAQQKLTGSFFDDTNVGCQVTDSDGQTKTVYLTADTGHVVQTDKTGFALESSGENYLARYTADGQTQYIYGTRESEPLCLYPEEEQVLAALALNGAVGCEVDAEGLHLGFYDLSSGQRTAQVVLPGVAMPEALVGSEDCIWLVAEGVLYRWELAATPSKDRTVHSGPRYTADQPDTAGLADCQLRVQRLQDTYGLKLYIYTEAAELTAETTLEKEYRVSVINECLDEIEAVLTQLPEGFVSQTGDMSFYLVKALKNGKPAAQNWNGNTSHVVMTGEKVTEALLWGLGFGVDTYVLNHCRAFDNWSDWNPDAFEYSYSYKEDALPENCEEYREWFVDMDSMRFPTEDRSRIFTCAMLPGNGELFAGEDLQDKLLQLCEGIREAYDWEDSTTVFPWEQYLEEPIAEEE